MQKNEFLTFLEVGYMSLDESSEEFIVTVSKTTNDGIIHYNSTGVQDATALNISNIQSYIKENSNCFKVTAKINANLYEEITGEYSGKIENADIIFGLCEPLDDRNIKSIL